MSGVFPGLEQRITRAWYQGGSLWLWLLWPLSLLFGAATAVRRRRWRQLPPEPLPVPVVVVGGITVGGTGKTPVIIALVKALVASGLKVGVVSRGYGGNIDGPPVVVDARATASMVGDEPLLIALSCDCPVVVSPDRPEAVRTIAKLAQLDVVLSDDGLQHYAMFRDFEILVLDAHRRLGNGRLLPMGPLREGAWRLDTVDWLLERNGDHADTGFRYAVHGFRQWQTRAVMRTDQAIENWRNCKVAAVTGLGQPEQFFAMLEGMGLETSRHTFPDHYALTRADLDSVWGDVIVMTEKDAVKIQAFDDERIWVMSISALVPGVLVDQLVARFGQQSEGSCSTL